MADRVVCPYGCGKEWIGTSSRRADSPLDPDAVAQADQETWSNCPRLTSPDGTQRQLTMEDHDEFCRRVWMDAYLAALNQGQPSIDPPNQNVDPTNPIEICDTANLVVRVTNDTGAPIENASVTVDGIGTMTTDSSGIADFGEVAPGSYAITAEKDHHSPQPAVPHGPAETTAEVPAGTTTVVPLQLIATCTSYYLNAPFLIGQATDPVMLPVNPQAVHDNIFNGAPLGFGQDITFGMGRPAPGGESVGTTIPALDARMRRLPAEMAANDTTGMAIRLVNSFLTPNTSVQVFIDPDLDAAISRHANFIDFADRTLLAPPGPRVAGRIRLDEALQNAGWNVNSVAPITDLGPPAFNNGNLVLGTGDMGNGLFLMINGVAYVFVYVQAYEYHSCTEEYTITLKFAVYDVFGLDDVDLDRFGADTDWSTSGTARGITAWWQLQHQFGYVPLISRAVVERKFTVSTHGR